MIFGSRQSINEMYWVYSTLWEQGFQTICHLPGSDDGKRLKRAKQNSKLMSNVILILAENHDTTTYLNAVSLKNRIGKRMRLCLHVLGYLMHITTSKTQNQNFEEKSVFFEEWTTLKFRPNYCAFGTSFKMKVKLWFLCQILVS